MKKKTRLVLNRETVRVLSRIELTMRGGAPNITDPLGICFTEAYYCGQTVRECPTDRCGTGND